MLQVCASPSSKFFLSCASPEKAFFRERRRPIFRIRADGDSSTVIEEGEESGASGVPSSIDSPSAGFPSDKDLKKVEKNSPPLFIWLSVLLGCLE